MPFFDNNPDKYNKLLSNYRVDLDKMYNSMSKDDSFEVVMAALNLLKKTRTMPKVPKSHKSEELSFPCRQTGYALFQSGDFNNALQMCNLAIGSAPKGSLSLACAYSNRSALFQEVKVYSAALKDIETCLTMNCLSADIVTKLKLRREECRRLVSKEQTQKDQLRNGFGKEFFDLSEDCHPQIPSVIKSVDVLIENQIGKFVAAKDIPVGSVVAEERAFASNLESNNNFSACHYCHKFVFNLIPCDNCCATFFCSDSCKTACLVEFHSIECQFIDLVTEAFPDDLYRIPLKAALKMKSMAKSWEELISITSNAFDKAYDKSLSELYDTNNIQSVLNINNNNNHFVYGQMYNHSLITATIIHHLEKIPGYFPTSVDMKQQAIQTFSRIIMHLIPLNPQFIMIQNSALSYPTMDITLKPEANTGLFPFTCNLKHACEPNLLVLGIYNKVALVATKTITKGTELTISYVGHWFDKNYCTMRAAKLIFIKPACQCRVCVGKWSNYSVKDGNNRASDRQKKSFVDWIKLRIVTSSDANAVGRMFDETCKGLDLWQDKPNTKQYLELYAYFREMLCRWQYLTTDNGCIDV